MQEQQRLQVQHEEHQQHRSLHWEMPQFPSVVGPASELPEFSLAVAPLSSAGVGLATAAPSGNEHVPHAHELASIVVPVVSPLIDRRASTIAWPNPVLGLGIKNVHMVVADMIGKGVNISEVERLAFFIVVLFVCAVGAVACRMIAVRNENTPNCSYHTASATGKYIRQESLANRRKSETRDTPHQEPVSTRSGSPQLPIQALVSSPRSSTFTFSAKSGTGADESLVDPFVDDSRNASAPSSRNTLPLSDRLLPPSPTIMLPQRHEHPCSLIQPADTSKYNALDESLPPLYPSLTFPVCEDRFSIAMDSFSDAWAVGIPIGGRAGNVLMHVSVQKDPGGAALELSVGSPGSCPRATIRMPQTRLVQEHFCKHEVEIWGATNMMYGMLSVKTSTLFDVIRCGGPVMQIDCSLMFVARAMDGKVLGSAKCGNTGDLEFDIPPGNDAVLILLCILAVILLFPPSMD